MNRYSILAVCLHNIASHVTQNKKHKWDNVCDAVWLKQTIDIKGNTHFFENVIDIK